MTGNTNGSQMSTLILRLAASSQDHVQISVIYIYIYMYIKNATIWDQMHLYIPYINTEHVLA